MISDIIKKGGDPNKVNLYFNYTG